MVGRYVTQQTETCLLTAERGSTALTQLCDLLSTLLSCFCSPRLLCPLLLHFSIFSTNCISFPSAIFSLTLYYLQLHKSIQMHVTWYRKLVETAARCNGLNLPASSGISVSGASVWGVCMFMLSLNCKPVWMWVRMIWFVSMCQPSDKLAT